MKSSPQLRVLASWRDEPLQLEARKWRERTDGANRTKRGRKQELFFALFLLFPHSTAKSNVARVPTKIGCDLENATRAKWHFFSTSLLVEKCALNANCCFCQEWTKRAKFYERLKPLKIWLIQDALLIVLSKKENLKRVNQQEQRILCQMTSEP